MEDLIKDFKKIETLNDLKKRNITISEYNTIFLIIKNLQQFKKFDFLQESIKNYLIKFNIKVFEAGIGWRASR